MSQIYQKLSIMQKCMNVPKNQENTEDGYRYRTCDDILRAAKPLLAMGGMTLLLSDELAEVGGHTYVKATATLTDIKTGESVSSCGYAMEEMPADGTSCSRATGSASTDARKTALAGMFLLDDGITIDPDQPRIHTGYFS